jgi:ParB family chromosome partitioning protein
LKRILLPVRNLQQWIEHNILLELASAPFSKQDAQLVPEAGSCMDCPKRTGHNTLLFDGMATRHDSCTSPDCYQMKVNAHVAKTIAAEPKLVQITTAYGKPSEGSSVIPRNQYIEIKQEKPQNNKQRDWPEYKTCKSTTEAIITEGTEKGELRKICADPTCSIHHPNKQKPTADANWKAEQEKQRREEVLAQATGLRVLSAISEAVPVRLMKRDLLFVVERLAAMLDERRLSIVMRQHGIGKSKVADAPAKLLGAFIRNSGEGTLGRLLVELAIFSAPSLIQTAKVLRDAAQLYKVDIEAITAKVKQEFSAKEKAKATQKATVKPQTKAAKKSTAA